MLADRLYRMVFLETIKEIPKAKVHEGSGPWVIEAGDNVHQECNVIRS